MNKPTVKRSNNGAISPKVNNCGNIDSGCITTLYYNVVKFSKPTTWSALRPRASEFLIFKHKCYSHYHEEKRSLYFASQYPQYS